MGLQNILSIGLKLDLLAEVYRDSAIISSGQLNSFFPGIGTGGFNGANLATIPFALFLPVNFPEGTNLKIKLSVRNACDGSLRDQGIARLWYGDDKADSQFGAAIGETNSDYYLLNNFLLATVAGEKPRKHIDLQAGERCSSFKPFGTWTGTL